MSLDVAIKKSLYDGKIESVVYNPNIVINENSKNIKDKIKQLLENSTRVDIAISYVVWSGLSLIYDDLVKFESDSRLILTVEGMVSDPRSLEKLQNLKMQVKVYVPNSDSKGFHLKSYLFETGEKRTLLIGSANISSRAFGLAHEMAVEIDANSKGYIIERYNSAFQEIWENEYSLVLSEEFVKGYREVYKQKKKIDEDMNHRFLDGNEIRPNYMQKKALIELEHYRSNNDRGLVIAATGTGKTYLSAFDVRASGAKKILFLVHNRLILTAAQETYKKIFNNKKIIELNSGNIEEVSKADFIFTTDITAFRYLIDFLPKDYFDYIVYDEAHRIGLDTKYEDLINYFQPEFMLGMTATPERTDNPDYLFKIFKYNVPYEIRLLDAMDHELICPFTYYGLNLDERLLERNEQFNYAVLADYIKKIINQKGHYGEKLKCLIFCSNIKEARLLSESLNGSGLISVAAVSGKDNVTRSKIESYIQDLKSNVVGTLEIICTVNKFNEGIDIPDINTIIMLRNTTSSIIYLQQLGRGLRRTSDPHKFVTVFDIIGNSKNNYTIAEVLTGNSTVDKRKLYMYTNENFKTVSPFINVKIEKQAMDKIIKSISNNFTVKTKLKAKFKNELHRYPEIPTLKQMYLNKNFQEIELLQLLHKNFYDPFEEYYFEKYDISKGNKFVSGIFTLLSQFIFRAYDKEILSDYVSLLKGEKVNNDMLRRILLPAEFTDGISTAINSEYNKKNKGFPKAFKFVNNYLSLNPEIKELLKANNASELFEEHIELLEHLSEYNDYEMKTFDLVDKGEFLYNVGSKDCYMNVVGERIDKDKKEVYCTIKITEKESFYDNYIVGNNKVVYYTQGSRTKELAIDKINMFIEDKYKFYICAQFPHLGYSNTAYFNLGNVSISKISGVLKTNKDKYNHEITFQLEQEIPKELLFYNELE